VGLQRLAKLDERGVLGEPMGLSDASDEGGVDVEGKRVGWSNVAVHGLRGRPELPNNSEDIGSERVETYAGR
jgi:hypothetical protein